MVPSWYELVLFRTAGPPGGFNGPLQLMLREG